MSGNALLAQLDLLAEGERLWRNEPNGKCVYIVRDVRGPNPMILVAEFTEATHAAAFVAAGNAYPALRRVIEAATAMAHYDGTEHHAEARHKLIDALAALSGNAALEDETER